MLSTFSDITLSDTPIIIKNYFLASNRNINKINHIKEVGENSDDFKG